MADKGIFKVIPSGITEGKRVRATLMLSPPADPATLKDLPTRQIAQWRGERDWTIPLRVVTLRINTGGCVDSMENAICGAKTLPAHAASMEKAWSKGEEKGWIAELWEQGIVRDRAHANAVWDQLAKLIEASNGGKNLQAGAELRQAAKAAAASTASSKCPPVTAPAPQAVTPPPAAAKEVKEETRIQAILPSRQSDLALLLESERAWEICATTRWASGDLQSCVAEEESCLAKLSKATDDDQKKLRDQARDRFTDAEKSITNLYACSIDPDEKASAKWAVDPVAIGVNRDEVSKHLIGAARSQQEANRVETPIPCADPDKEKTSQAFFAIQGSPSLSRLFGLTVDLEIDPKQLNAGLGLTEQQASEAATVVHLLLGVNDVDAGSRTVWTLVRYRPAGDMHFMPASRLELRWSGKERFHPQASQHEGVLVLGQELDPDSDTPISRFVLTSLDVPRATNGTFDRLGVTPTKPSNTWMQANPGKAPDQWKAEGTEAEPLLASRPTRWKRKTHSTAGMVLLDRGRLEQAVQQFAARGVHGTQPKNVLLDSNDLLIGYRLDVGVPVTAKKGGCDFTWRSLMSRNVRHGNGSKHAKNVYRATRLLMGGSDSTEAVSDWQRTLDDAQLSLPARLVDSANKSGDRNAKDAHVEEVVAVWTGEPMAALCAAGEELKQSDAHVGAGEIITLPTDARHSDRVPPPLRFGWPFRVGVRAVYAGGISLPLTHAKPLYDGGKESCTSMSKLALPARETERSGIRRHLRHERVAAPFLLMHHKVAVPDAVPAMGYERSAHAIVRSAHEDSPAKHGTPRTTQRIFVPPSVEMHFAAMHGVFDERAPRRALPHMRFDSKQGGFPFVTAKSVEGINGETFYGPREIASTGDERGDAVYMEKRSHDRHHAYYPDPTARRWVIAVRHAKTNRYLEGPPVHVPIRKQGEAYPTCRPLVLRIESNGVPPRPAGKAPTLQQVLSESSKPSSPLVTDGVEVVAKLAPGEDFEVDVWCAPDADDLADYFAPVETIATLALLRARKLNKMPLREAWPHLMTELETMLPPVMVEAIRRHLAGCGCWPPSDALKSQPLNDGVGGLGAPGRETRKAIAVALYETLCGRPVDEIAAVQTLRVTHVTSHPVRRPAFEPQSSERKLQVLRAVAGGSIQEEVKTPVEYFLSGAVWIDLRTTGSVEFRARVTSPTNSAFDDPRRGRSARDRRNGTWPHVDKNTPLTSEDVFGFEVCADGRARLPMREISLLCIEDLARPSPAFVAAEPNGMWRLQLEDLVAGTPGGPWGRVTSRHVFPDRKARRLFVRIIARTRHEELMRTGSGVAKVGKWLQPGQDPEAPKDDHEKAIEVWLPAAIRPSEPVAQTPTPAFVWDKRTTSLQRRAVIRVPLGRGWFSSGEGERLGVVVWPPGSLDAVAQVPILGTPAEPRRNAPLPRFVDEDLGPGGRFVTRWGSDPTKRIDTAAPSDAHLPGFLDPTAFRDLGSEKTGTQFSAQLVSSVRMPVRQEATDSKPGAEAPHLTLDVSLVTYEPLFEIESEQWYVDISIAHPFEAQPFIRLGLVRFQPNAPADLQVSYPTTQWVQLLPERYVWMFTEDEAKEKSTWLTVEGLGPPSPLPTDAADEVVGTRMSARVVSEYINEAGISCQYTRPPVGMTPTSKTSGDDGAYSGPRWLWTFKVDVDELDSECQSRNLTGAQHFVYIEEREAYLPATYAQEPVQPIVAAGILPSKDHVETGPRFAARLPLRRPPRFKQ